MPSSVASHLAATLEFSESDKQLNGKKILVVLTGIIHREDIYKQAHKLGAKLYFFDSHVPEWASCFAEDIIHCDSPTDVPTACKTIQEYISKNSIKFDGVVTYDEYGIIVWAKIAQVLGLPATDPHTVSICKNKYDFRKATGAAGILAPEALRLSLKKLKQGAYDTTLSTFPFPCVLKPIAGAGSHFVRRINDLPTLHSVLEEYSTEASVTGETKHWTTSESAIADEDSCFMIEELMVGNEVDVDMLVEHGTIKFLSIADNFPSKGPKELFMEAGGAQPSTLPTDKQREITEMTHKMVATFPRLHGCFHFEVMSTDKGAAPIELNQRLGGSEVLVFMLATYGVHLGLQALKLACDISLGEVNQTAQRQCVSINFLAPHSGYITRIGREEAIENDENFMGSMHRCVVGHALKAPPLGFEFLGWMVASGKDFEDAKQQLGRLEKLFYCDIKPFPRDDPHGQIPGTQVYYLDHE